MASAITNKLYQSPLRLTNGDAEASKEMVQQVWEKVLAKRMINSSKCPTPFLLKVLKNQYYGQQRAKNRVVHPSDDHLPLVVDKPEEPLAIWEKIVSVSQKPKDGWIYRETLDKDLDLKTLAQNERMTYEALRPLEILQIY
jgi:DNA-directed RNA polymerase specialized sigma24 family protein